MGMQPTPVFTVDGPLRPPGVGARVAPFAATAVVVTLVETLSGMRQPELMAAAGAVTVLVLLAALFVPWRRLPVSAQCAVPLSFFLAIGLLRAAGGGTTSSAGVLSLLPVCWVAMYGRRVALGATLVATAAIFIVPAIFVGGVTYPRSDIGRGAALMLVASVVGITVQAAMRALEAQRAEAQTTSHQLAVVASLMHGLRAGEEPRSVLCEGLIGVAGASMGILLEPRDAGLAVSASCGQAPCPGTGVPIGRPDVVGHAWASGRRLIVNTLPACLQPLEFPAGSFRTVLFEPIRREETTVGLLVAAWTSPIRAGDPAFDAVALIAVEAGVALGHADLLSTLDRRARTDALTEIANRRAWEETLAVELGGGSARRPLCVGLLDLDHFKRYNDTRGHPAGDLLLREAARAWQARLRDADTLARYGGEEFAVALPGCDLENGEAVLRELCSAMPDGQTVSAGLAEWDHQETPTSLMARVDAALYRAKASGRNAICTAEPAQRPPGARGRASQH